MVMPDFSDLMVPAASIPLMVMVCLSRADVWCMFVLTKQSSVLKKDRAKTTVNCHLSEIPE